jgi:hypothetical protein
MSITLSSIAPSSGGPIGFSLDAAGNAVGGQLVTISGTGMGSVSSVTIEGRAASIVSVSATQVTARVPSRQDSGVWNWTGGAVDVVVSDGSSSATLSSGYTYLVTIFEKSVNAIAARFAAAGTASGYYYDYSADQLVPFQTDPKAIDTGAAFPHGMLYVSEGKAVERTVPNLSFRASGVLVLWKPVAGADALHHEQSMMLADAHRMLFADVTNGGTSEKFEVDDWKFDHWDAEASGALAAVLVYFSYNYRHVWKDPNSSTRWLST